ncbi:MAG: hypothetical protein Athens071425_511 [Parcubacteria group bacterium Athens0714_25]|nr:MAG: hypothetical protein Athens071425_511 [Parcubacteria group bacterium Athens0714_25]
MEKFWNLKVFSKSHDLVKFTYELTESFPGEERFGLVSQMRRSAVSIVANIVESTKRKTAKDQSHFIVMSDTSLEELKYYFYLSFDLKYIKREASVEGIKKSREIGRMLNGLLNSYKKTNS